jgi:NodT family efflux transporter outer membrane factor (OMF) lipoprotein
MRKTLLTLGLPAVIAGCTVGPDYKSPQVQSPRAWASVAGSTTRPTTGPVAPTTQPVNLGQWWESFGDPQLSSLVRSAFDGNIGLSQAASRVRQARFARKAAASGYYPNVNVSGGYSRSGSIGDSIKNSHDLFTTGLDASWEIDVFGGTRRAVEAADADILASVEDYRDVMITLASEVALNYTDLRTTQERINIAKRNLEIQKQSLGLTQRLFAGGQGFVSGLDVANAEAQVASTESTIPSLESSERQIIYALSVLLGREPAALVAELSKPGPMVGSPPEVPLGLPSELLKRRPDLRRAEAQLHAATALTGVATADLYPKFSLTGSFGQSAGSLGRLLEGNSNGWSIGPSVSWPLFDAGRIRANIAVQNELQEQALLAFRGAVLGAWQDVENALIAYAKEQERHRSLSDSVTSNRRAVDYATTLYKQGQTDFLNVINAQRSLFAAEDALVQSDRTLTESVIALYKALGGGW